MAGLSPDEVECPLTLDILEDPICLPCCGKTCSREPLAIHYHTVAKTCPLCRADLKKKRFDPRTAPPNRLVQAVVDAFKASCPTSGNGGSPFRLSQQAPLVPQRRESTGPAVAAVSPSAFAVATTNAPVLQEQHQPQQSLTTGSSGISTTSDGREFILEGFCALCSLSGFHHEAAIMHHVSQPGHLVALGRIREGQSLDERPPAQFQQQQPQQHHQEPPLTVIAFATDPSSSSVPTETPSFISALEEQRRRSHAPPRADSESSATAGVVQSAATADDDDPTGARFIVNGRCTLCEMTCDNWKTKQTHLAGFKHKDRLRRLRDGSLQRDASSSSGSPSFSEDTYINCPNCQRRLTSFTSHTTKNPNRKFYTCKNCSSGKNFFAWVDEWGIEKGSKATATATGPGSGSQTTAEKNIEIHVTISQAAADAASTSGANNRSWALPSNRTVKLTFFPARKDGKPLPRAIVEFSPHPVLISVLRQLHPSQRSFSGSLRAWFVDAEALCQLAENLKDDSDIDSCRVLPSQAEFDAFALGLKEHRVNEPKPPKQPTAVKLPCTPSSSAVKLEELDSEMSFTTPTAQISNSFSFGGGSSTSSKRYRDDDDNDDDDDYAAPPSRVSSRSVFGSGSHSPWGESAVSSGSMCSICERRKESGGGQHVCRLYGTFECDSCSNTWTSAFTWRNPNGQFETQECRRCNYPNEPVEWKPRDKAPSGRIGGGPHDSSRCGRCQRLGYPCHEF